MTVSADLRTPLPTGSVGLRALAAVAGPAVAGAACGLCLGNGHTLRLAVSLPAIFVGLALLTGPALYIAAAFLDLAPEPGRLARGVARSVSDAGIVLLGLCPALLLLISTATATRSVLAFSVMVVALAAVLGLGLACLRVFGGRGHLGRGLALSMVWALICMGIGARLFFQAATGG